jgi:hypothetical protein
MNKGFYESQVNIWDIYTVLLLVDAWDCRTAASVPAGAAMYIYVCTNVN